MLGGLEQKIMGVLWDSQDPLKPADVLKKLKGDHAYTTIMTVLKRMADKKLVTRTPLSNTFIYSPVADKCTFAASALDDLFARLFESYGEHVIPSFKKIAAKSGFSL
jgi:predicted transcriptional regulator